jgi:uncharacterized protein (DUF1800 family)
MKKLSAGLCTALLLAACAPTSQPPHYRAIAETAAPLDTTPGDLQVLSRISWGANTTSAQLLRTEGLRRYQRGQLHPSDNEGLPDDAKSLIAAMDISRKTIVALNGEARELQAAAQRVKGTPEFDAAQKAYQQRLSDWARETATRSLLRDLYSRNQLREQLVWFWMNHFNVSQNKGDIRVFLADYEEHAIRPHVLGHFRDLLAATAFHPAMLQYLDNAQNAAGHINENYAREIMELHTMGVGSGYSQSDVQELARILTGLGIARPGKPPTIRKNLRDQYRVDGVFEFNPNRHDYGDKQFLGTTIKGAGLKEVDAALALLARQPATARFISTKLAQYFCCDSPPEALVAAMAKTFGATDGDIAAVLETLFAAPEFSASLGQKFKDPVHYTVGALRLAYGDTVVLNCQPLLNWLDRAGEPLYRHDTPDGYPLTEAAWSSPGQLETRFEIARLIANGRSGLFKLPDDPAKEPAPPPDIQKSHYISVITPALRPATVEALAQAKSPVEWNMLFLSSPDFMRR